MKVSRLDEIGDNYKNYDVVAIDEGQFFLDVNKQKKKKKKLKKNII